MFVTAACALRASVNTIATNNGARSDRQNWNLRPATAIFGNPLKVSFMIQWRNSLIERGSACHTHKTEIAADLNGVAVQTGDRLAIRSAQL